MQKRVPFHTKLHTPAVEKRDQASERKKSIFRRNKLENDADASLI
jgi:hypothetical protein